MYIITGSIQINQHCRFPWTEREGEPARRVEIRRHHCGSCIDELGRLALSGALELVDRRAEPAQASSCRLLVVDDDPAIRETLRGVLTEEGYLVETACDGSEALAVLAAKPGVDVMLLDLMLPNLDGWQVLEAMKRNPTLSSVRVCVVTATASPRPEGSDHVLRKPVDLTRLLDVVHDLC